MVETITLQTECNIGDRVTYLYSDEQNFIETKKKNINVE